MVGTLSRTEQVHTSRTGALERAAELMVAFADRTGLTSQHPPRRYLWTDAFAVCNFLALAQATGDEHHLELALRLVDRVHHVLGRHRDDDSRSGWVSGLAEGDGELHPTAGGLRIGKSLPERRPTDRFDERLEWDRDGQYFHYLTKWMHALDRVAATTGETKFHVWALELADAAHRGFVRAAAGRAGKTMMWKASIDLSRPLVPTMGMHDAIDGLVTCAQLLANASSSPPELVRRVDHAASDFAAMLGNPSAWTTLDPLGIGALLVDAHRVDQLLGRVSRVDAMLRDDLLAAALTSLEHHVRQRPGATQGRLAFRELGLAIGLHALEQMSARPAGLAPLFQLRDGIESFWLAPAQRSAIARADHRDIDEVMLATALLPTGFLHLGPPAGNDRADA